MGLSGAAPAVRAPLGGGAGESRAGRGLRPFLEPALYIGIAAFLHGAILLIPLGPVGRGPAADTIRGVRVKAFQPSPPASPRAFSPPPPPQAAISADVPPEAADRTYSMAQGGSPGPAEVTVPGPAGPAGPIGEGGASDRSIAGRSGSVPESEYGAYLARLRSDKVQRWARDSASASRQSWRGTAKGGRDGWGSGGGGSAGGGAGTQPGRGGSGSGFLDPRVRMVVTSYPLDKRGNVREGKAINLEGRYPQVPYPELKVKAHERTAGWWNVFIRMWTDGAGNVIRSQVLRPETDGPLERMFLAQVQNEIARWNFDPLEAEIVVDVRFHVE